MATGNTSGNRKKRTSERDAKKAAYEAKVQEYVQQELKRRERRRRMLIGVCAVLGAACLLYVGFYGYEDYRTRKSYEEMASIKESAQKTQNFVTEEEPESPTINYTNEDKNAPEVLDEYKKLYNSHKKLIGWLKIDDTNIDYPVMQTNNNEYYLDHNMNQEIITKQRRSGLSRRRLIWRQYHTRFDCLFQIGIKQLLLRSTGNPPDFSFYRYTLLNTLCHIGSFQQRTLSCI